MQPDPDHMVNPQAETDRLIAELDAHFARRRIEAFAARCAMLRTERLARSIVTGIVG